MLRGGGHRAHLRRRGPSSESYTSYTSYTGYTSYTSCTGRRDMQSYTRKGIGRRRQGIGSFVEELLALERVRGTECEMEMEMDSILLLYVSTLRPVVWEMFS